MVGAINSTEKVIQKQLAKQIAEKFTDPESVIKELQNPVTLQGNGSLTQYIRYNLLRYRYFINFYYLQLILRSSKNKV